MKFEKIEERFYHNFLLETESSLTTDDQFQSMIDYFKTDLLLPKRGTINSAGYDFYAPKTIILKPGEKRKIGSGIKVSLDSNKVLLTVPRSSIGIKRNIILANTIGVIDADYYSNEDNDGHIIFVLKNIGNETITIERNERFAQGIIVGYFTTEDDESSTKRTGGIGSTDEPTKEIKNEAKENHEKLTQKVENTNKYIDDIGHKKMDWKKNNHYKK